MASLPQHQILYTPNRLIPFAVSATPCGDVGVWFTCNRPHGHGGRHSYVWHNAGPMSGNVRGVWK